MKRKIVNSPLILILPFLLYSCGGTVKKAGGRPEVVVHMQADPESLNPDCYTSAEASNVLRFMFESPMDIDFKTLELVPVLVEGKPLVEKLELGKLKFTYRLRPEAKWDNGAPITAKDVDFSMKIIKNPKVNNPQTKPLYEHLSEFIYDSSDPLKYSLIYDTTYIGAEMNCGAFPILPEYFYDPKGLMKDFTVKQITLEKEKLAADPKINEFANEFNSEKYAREKNFFSGSGPYSFEEWVTGQRVVLKRKENWWGDKLKGTNLFFEANAPKLIYKVVNDMTSALVALKAGDLDVMHTILAKNFAELEKSDKFKANYNAYTPMSLSYYYLGINMKRPKFADRRTREALAHLIDVNKMIQTVMYGYAQVTIGPIHPSKTKLYNSEIKPYEYDLEKARKLLADAGWKDSNNDGTIDKVIDGQRTEFTIDFTYNAGSDYRKQTILLFQEEARKVGIKVNVLAQEWAIFVDNSKKHNFDMLYGGWIAAPVLPDLKQIYHTESALNGGSNYTASGNAKSDALIDSIRVEMDEEKRNGMYKRIQQMLHDEVGMIYLYAPTERIAIHKRFVNAETSVMRPGYYEASFTTAEMEKK